MERFTGDTVIVTGSTRGIGEAVAKRFASEGARVVVTGRSESDGERVADVIRTAGGEAAFVQCDLRNPDAVRALVRATVERYDSLDVLVNNAAVQTETSVTSATLDDWESVVETDFRSYWLCVKYAAEYMESGSIVNVSSNHAYSTMPSHFPYNAVKAGINGMTRAMALDLAPEIRANAINPGWVLVDRTDDALGPDERDRLEDIHPVKRLGRPEDVAGLAAFLASEEASFLTGECVLLDGGRGAVMEDDRIA